MPSDTNSEIDTEGVMEEPGSGTCIKLRKRDKNRKWSQEAQAIAAAMAPMTEVEQKLMLERMTEALGLKPK